MAKAINWLYFCLTAHVNAGLDSRHLAFGNDSKLWFSDEIPY